MQEITCFSQNDWDELQVVMLGAFMEPSKVRKIFDATYLEEFVQLIQRVADETAEDLDKIQKKLEDQGVKVLRPDMNMITERQIEQSESIKLNLNTDDVGIASDIFFQDLNIPISPRNDLMVYKDVVFSNFDMERTYNVKLNNTIVNTNQKFGYDYLDWPSITRVNNRLVIGEDFDRSAIDKIKQYLNNAELVITDIRGHVDATLACIRDGLLLTTDRHPDEIYNKTFPNWKKQPFGNSGFQHLAQQLTGWRKAERQILHDLQEVTKSKWWIEDFDQLENKKQVADIINNCFKNWFGYCEETYFEINCLTINPDLSMVIGECSQSAQVLKEKYNHDTILVPFRHRWFFDQGLHCLTADLVRKA